MDLAKSRESARALFASLLPPRTQSSFRFVWLNNFEAERFWAPRHAVQLPKFSQPTDVAIVNRLEEMGLFLAQYPDVLILREPSDRAFLAYLSDLGFDLPIMLTVAPADKVTPISEAILADEAVRGKLSELAMEEGACYLLPFAKTKMEEKISDQTGLESLGPSAAICERVNSKIYSRKISNELGLRTIPGAECESIASLEGLFERFAAHLSERRSVVLKEAMGVSGKGLYVADTNAKLQQIIGLIKRKAKPEDEVAFVMEVWVDKLKDINYQIFISPSGETRLLALKEIVTRDGVHLGHRFPADLTAAQMACYEEAAEAVGARLFEDGFTGLAGIDSIIDREGAVYPVLEINARLNMSSYQLGLEWLIDPRSCVLAKHYPLLLKRPLSFSDLKSSLGPDLFIPSRNNAGALIQNFATVNVNFNPGDAAPFKGRLYSLIVGRNFEEVVQIDQRISLKLGAWQAAESSRSN
jgi:Pre ATP-grasp domain/Carbamoyl-phosphate synthase L chain, ATP binding domain